LRHAEVARGACTSMRLPRLPYVVVDANRLRREEAVRPLIEAFDLSKQQVMLPWVTAFELTKGDGDNFFSSIRSFRCRPEMVSIARASMAIARTIELETGRMATDITDETSTCNLRAALSAMRDGRRPSDEARRALATTHMEARRIVEGANYDRVFRKAVEGMRQEVPAAERNLVKRAIERGDREPFRKILVETFACDRLQVFLDAEGVPAARARELARMPSFASLQIVAWMTASFRWTVLGGIENTKKVQNDGVDIEHVLIAPYGRDFISGDHEAHELYDDLKAIAAGVWE
jgi:hypothetical protein